MIGGVAQRVMCPSGQLAICKSSLLSSFHARNEALCSISWKPHRGERIAAAEVIAEVARGMALDAVTRKSSVLSGWTLPVVGVMPDDAAFGSLPRDGVSG